MNQVKIEKNLKKLIFFSVIKILLFWLYKFARANPHAQGQNKSIKPIGLFNLVNSTKIFNWFMILLVNIKH